LRDKDNLHIFFKDNRLNLVEQSEDLVVRSSAAKNKNSVLSAALVKKDGEIKRLGVVEYYKEPYDKYRFYNVRSDLYPVNEHKEIIGITYYGKKKFGLVRFSTN